MLDPRFLLLVAFPSLAATPVLAQRDSPFMTEFRQLMQIRADEDMAKLIKKNFESAILAVREVAFGIRDGSNDILEQEMDALGRAWKKAYDSEFVSIQYDYFSIRLSGPYRKSHRDLVKRYELKRAEYIVARDKKELLKLPSLSIDFDSFGDGFGELGDDYLASESYRASAECNDEVLAGKSGDKRKACEAWSLMMQARDKIELHDAVYSYGKSRFEELEATGFGDPAKAEPTPPVETGGAAAAGAVQPIPLQATFELIPDIESILRPIYLNDANFQIWAEIGIGAVNASAKFLDNEDAPTLLRTGASKAAVDLDGDGKGDVDIPLTGKISPVELTLGTGDKLRKWAFLAAVGQERDTYQGFTRNLAPNDQYLNLFVAPAASLVGTVEGVRVQVIDDNLDGKYGSPPRGWGYPGLLAETFQKDTDSVLIGESKVARPWSRLQKIGANWYQLAPNANGTDLVATREDVKSGTLQLDLKGLPVTWLVVRGTGNNEELFFELVNGGTNKAEVPVGAYEVFAGQVASGKKAQMMKCLILPGPNSRAYKVGPGETTKLELGQPLTLDFHLTQNDESLTVIGPSIVVVGRGGETYQRLWNCVLTPEVNLRKAGSSKGKKEAKLVPVTSQEQLEAQKYVLQTAWFPVGEPIQKSNPGEKLEAQLFEKKHKLFGKLESDWKSE
jgi:hypothetical protein